jgi:serine/threonine protein kinase/tetratricopeptide (TPR) repeat protein
MTAAADRHLLFGLLALQNGLIDQGQLMLAFQAWTRDKSQSLADHLEARGDLTGAKKALLYALAEVHLEAHGGDVEKSLAAIPANRSTRAGLVDLGEPEIEATLARIARPKNGPATAAEDGDPERTGSYAVGSATSEGQRFRILRPHARGGLGEVFVALDGELHREVALKQILEKHADDPVSRQRFLLEAEITGGLEHPGVVPVHGLGADAGGRPYYAMRLIKGDSLKQAIEHFHAAPGRESAGSHATNRSRKTRGVDASPLAFRQLLRRFLDVCNAIDYAHSRGVIHRDLKPANIIVGKHGETLVVDWGLAKAVGRADPSVGEQTLAPSSSGSSETLPGSALGTPAYMSPEQARGELDRLGPRSDVYSLGATLFCLLTGKPPFENQDIGEILHAVQEGRFQRPSHDDPALDKALEAVCLKAMATRPEDRYPTPKALADDLERWMADEPVTAWREPFTRRARRWARRNRTAVTSLVVAVLVALAGTAAVLAVQTWANGRLQQANSELAIANARVTRANSELKSANEREKQRFSLAMDAINLFHGEVSEDLLLKEEQFGGLRNKLLKGAADFYGRLEHLLKGQSDRASHAALGRAFDELGELMAKIGDQQAALAVHRKALAARRALASEPGADEKTKLDVARSLKAIGLLQKSAGDMAGARASFEEALRLAQEPPAHGGSSEQARAVQGMAYHYFAGILSDTGDPRGALSAYSKALAIRQKLADADPGVTEFQNDLANTHNNIALVQQDIGDHIGAIASYRRAVTIQQKLVAANPSVIKLQSDLAHSHHNIGVQHLQIGKTSEALESARRALVIEQKLADAKPSVTPFQRATAMSQHVVGRCLSEMGDKAGGLLAYRNALAIEQKLALANPANTDFQRSLATTLDSIGVTLLGIGDKTGGREACGQALAILQKLADSNPKVIGFRTNLAIGAINFSEFLRKERSLAEARDGYDRAIAIVRGLLKDLPNNRSHQDSLAYGLRGRGLARLELGDLVGATADTRGSLGIWEGRAQRSGWDWFQIGCCHATLSALAGRAGTGIPAHEASAEVDQAMAMMQKAVDSSYRHLGEYRDETALGPLRDREDFRLLMMDLAFPAEPFAPRE